MIPKTSSALISKTTAYAVLVRRYPTVQISE